MEHIAQGKRSDTLGLPHSRVSTPCKGKSLNPLCCYFYLIADLAVLSYVYFVQHLRHVLKLLPLQGATAPTCDTQGAASLALGYVLHWAFIDIIGCGSAIQASLIAFALHDDSARPY